MVLVLVADIFQDLCKFLFIIILISKIVGYLLHWKFKAANYC